LGASKWPKIKIPPHLAVTIASLSGAYIGGTNGFSTIQALFNKNVVGMHLINGESKKGAYLRDKSGNQILIDQYFHKNAFADQFVGLQKEFLIQNPILDLELKLKIENILVSRVNHV
jgi:hypothetical protein